MRGLLYTALAASLAACSKAAAPAPPQAPVPPAPAPSQAPSPAPSATPAPSPAPAAAPAATPSPAPQAKTPTPTPPPQATNGDAAVSQHPLGNDLRNLEIAARLREEFEPVKDQVIFEFKVTMADGSNPIDETFVLVETSGVESALLKSELRPGFHIMTYQLSETDHGRMHAADALLKKLIADSTGGNDLTFQATVQTRLKPDVVKPDTFSLTIYARSHPSVDFVALGEEKIVRATDPDAGELFT